MKFTGYTDEQKEMKRRMLACSCPTPAHCTGACKKSVWRCPCCRKINDRSVAFCPCGESHRDERVIVPNSKEEKRVWDVVTAVLVVACVAGTVWLVRDLWMRF